MNYIVIVPKWIFGKQIEFFVHKIVSYKKHKMVGTLDKERAFHYKVEKSATNAAMAFNGKVIII